MKRKSKEMNLEELPGEILELIFSKLRFVNLPTCRLVCKSWNTLVLTCKFDASISNFFFAQISPSWNHLHSVDFSDHKSSEGIDIVASLSLDPSWSSSDVKIINSCNGLLCCSLRSSSTRTEAICILNPMTNEYFKLPNSPSYSYGFGFSIKTKQYKIVRHSFVIQKLSTLVEIFAFGTSRSGCSPQWTHVTILPKTLRGHGTCFNGALYWVGAQPDQPSTYVIFRLDLEDEKFEEICLIQPPEAYFGFLGVFDGTLYLTFLRQRYYYEVWKMEQDSSSWFKAFVVTLPLPETLVHRSNLRLIKPYYRTHHLQLIKAYEDGKILCLAIGNLILYDSKTGRTQIIQNQIKRNKYLLVYQIDCFSFDSLNKILGGDHS